MARRGPHVHGQVQQKDDEECLWALLEAAWAPLGKEVNQARQALATRTPEPDEDLCGKPPLSVVEDALAEFMENLAADARDLSAEELIGLNRAVERKLYDMSASSTTSTTLTSRR
jgi:hypothetical protein